MSNINFFGSIMIFEAIFSLGLSHLFVIFRLIICNKEAHANLKTRNVVAT